VKSNNLAKSIDLVLKIDNKIIGGQQSAILNRKTEIIDITNHIDNEWQESLAGTKTWFINCNGLYVINNESLALLEDAFLNNKKLTVSFAIGNKKYEGECLIVDYPLNAIFNTQFKYSLKLLGTGQLYCY
jgi:predicted secreted protein